MNVTRPLRGVLRLDDLTWDPARLAVDVARFQNEEWETLGYGTAWTQLMIVRPDGEGGTWRHPLLAESPAIQEVFDAFPARVLDATLASLGPGGAIGEHRDISGGTPMGVGRFHVPVISHPEVRFFVSGQRLYLAPGETWNLDTTYKHKLRNASDVTRIHLIIDVELNDAVRAMMPPTDLRDRVHQAHFAAICVGKGAKLAVKDPRALATRVRKFFKLLIFNQSVLRPED